jgi:hypothetical protein
VSYGDSDFRAAVMRCWLTCSVCQQDTLNYITQYAAMNPLPIPISQITGFTQFTAQNEHASRLASPPRRAATRTSPRRGRRLTGLTDGSWLFIHGASIDTSVRVQPGVDVDRRERCGRADDDGCLSEATTATSCAVANLKTLDNGGSSTVTCKYRTGVGATGRFGHRFLIGLKVGNL